MSMRLSEDIKRVRKQVKEAKQLAQSVIDGEFDLGVARTEIDKKLNNLETQYAPQLTEVTTQLAKTQSQKADRTELAQINTELDGVNQRIDNLVIPISPENVNVEVTDAHVSVPKGKTFNTINERMTESEHEIISLNKSSLKMKNLFINGDLSNGLSGFVGGNSERSIENGRLKVVATAKYGNATRQVDNLVIGHKYYWSVELEGTTNNFMKFLDVNIWNPSNGLNRLSAITESDRVIGQFQVADARDSNWTPFYADNYLVIDLTEAFGYGNEPTLEEMNTILLDTGWFNEKVPAFVSQKWLLSLMREWQSILIDENEAWEVI